MVTSGVYWEPLTYYDYGDFFHYFQPFNTNLTLTG